MSYGSPSGNKNNSVSLHMSAKVDYYIEQVDLLICSTPVSDNPFYHCALLPTVTV